MSSNVNIDQDFDSNDARTDFENVLQQVLDKANAEERLMSDVEEEEKEDSQKEKKSLPASPQKPLTPRANKRRRKRDDSRVDTQKSNTFIMKLFDRSVNLTSFSEQTPLYPICRAWMENDPHGKYSNATLNGLAHKDAREDDSSEDDESTSVISKISRPNIPWNNIDSNGKYRSPRVPKLLPQPKDNVNKYASRETLLQNHLQHWKKVRQTWKLKSLENDARYQDGMALLSNMFYRSTYSQSTNQ